MANAYMLKASHTTDRLNPVGAPSVPKAATQGGAAARLTLGYHAIRLRRSGHAFGVAAVAGSLCLLTGCDEPSAAQSRTMSAATPAAAADAAIERITAGTPQRKPIARHTSQPGRIAAFEQTPLYAKIDGYAESVLVDIGDQVKKGQSLVKLWVPELEDDLAQKQALLAQAKAEVDQAAAAVSAAEAAAETAAARIRESQAAIARSEGEYQRWKAESSRIDELVASGTVTRKLADETLNQFRAADASRQEAQARVQSAEAAANQARSGIDSAKADQAAAVARVRVAEANLKRAQTMLDYADIRAPYDGIVTHRNVDTGHFVQPGAPGGEPLLVVCHADVVRVFVDVPEMDAALIDRGDTAVVQLQSLDNMEVAGEVTRMGWVLDAANRSLRVEIDLDNKDRQLRPGMYATARILLDDRQQAIVLPVSAIVRTKREAHCCGIVDGKVRFIPITLGLRSGDELEITSGLKGNETIVLKRASELQEGQRVEIILDQK